MMAAARAAAALPALSALRLEESLKQFAAPLREQASLAAPPRLPSPSAWRPSRLPLMLRGGADQRPDHLWCLSCPPTLAPCTLPPQVDLAREATHLHAFNYNFRKTGGSAQRGMDGWCAQAQPDRPVVHTRPALPLKGPSTLHPATLEHAPPTCGAPLARCLSPQPPLGCCNQPPCWHLAGGVSFPVPLYPLVQPGVLVETFEAGTHISAYVAR
jgi:hypothetical protein